MAGPNTPVTPTAPLFNKETYESALLQLQIEKIRLEIEILKLDLAARQRGAPGFSVT